MANNTRKWADLVRLTQARAGAAFAAGTELENIGYLLNSAAHILYNETPWWERYLVVEERTVVDGYIPYEELGKDTIGEFITYYNGELWSGEGRDYRGCAYPDHNGIRITDPNVGATVWVAYKKEFTDVYGDGENGTIEDVPSEWFEFMAYHAARSYQESQGEQIQSIALSTVQMVKDQALMKISRQGIYDTIAKRFRTIYGTDVSVI